MICLIFFVLVKTCFGVPFLHKMVAFLSKFGRALGSLIMIQIGGFIIYFHAISYIVRIWTVWPLSVSIRDWTESTGIFDHFHTCFLF